MEDLTKVQSKALTTIRLISTRHGGRWVKRPSNVSKFVAGKLEEQGLIETDGNGLVRMEVKKAKANGNGSRDPFFVVPIQLDMTAVKGILSESACDEPIYEKVRSDLISHLCNQIDKS